MVRVKEVTFLGVILDGNLPWKPHISHFASKISKSVGIIGRSSPCLTKLASKTLYYLLIYPYFQYCTILWDSTYPTNNKLCSDIRNALSLYSFQSKIKNYFFSCY